MMIVYHISSPHEATEKNIEQQQQQQRRRRRTTKRMLNANHTNCPKCGVTTQGDAKTCSSCGA
ncbi:hypothetical protein L249_0364, partial [Ophiocordyceps polyrhachis-furcata BCC 54312]